ncbi:unnamed protein product [Musa acuminata subsp. malaccensis]|uniref:(wild Malaysian banana) hypothetical protein n=1 Tax=Musa acuminata subsp. malaccensis TaxID=214687 RepID=A0A804IZY1_MUSAM|nr:unnamed protein product [Musa acuminata subsp. malaccensis]
MHNISEENYKEALEASFKVLISRGISSELLQIVNDRSVEVDSRSSNVLICLHVFEGHQPFFF